MFLRHPPSRLVIPVCVALALLGCGPIAVAQAAVIPQLVLRQCSAAAPSYAAGDLWIHADASGPLVAANITLNDESLCATFDANPGEGLAIHTCDWAHSPQWTFNGTAGAGTIVLAANKQCLTATNATDLSMADCSSGATQQKFAYDSRSHWISSRAYPNQCVAWQQPSPPPQPSFGRYKVLTQDRQQTIWGFGYEIQSDSIGSNNQGLPASNASVPHDLTPDQRQSFFQDIIQGFRFCRLALGLFLRGLDPSEKYIQGRWPTQMAELKQMQDEGGIEGFAAEYWSPPPYWKDNKQYIGGSLASFNQSFLQEFGQARVADVKYLLNNGLKVAWWGLQNEPSFDTGASTLLPQRSSQPLGSTYSTCSYSIPQYYEAFKVVAPMIKSNFPNVSIHANSARGQAGCGPIVADPQVSPLVDGWTWHLVGANSDQVYSERQELTNNTLGKPVFNNEYEYFYNGMTLDYSTINTAQMILNFLVFVNSPTFYWIHAAKPTTNAESQGYGLAWWRPWNDTDYSHFPDLKPGHWQINAYNWPSLSGFVKHMPWDCVRYGVQEDETRLDQRIMAFKTPNTTVTGGGGPRHAHVTPPDRFGVIVTNRNLNQSFTYELSFDDGQAHTLSGHRYGPNNITDLPLGNITVPANQAVNLTVPPLRFDFWLEY